MNDLLAYFITFSCYGQHLPGDGPYTIDRQHNLPGMPPAPPSPPRRVYHVARLLHEPFVMDSAQRAIVLESVLEVCLHKGWYLVAVHVQSTHVHIVLQAPETRPEHAMGVFKARASRKLSHSGPAKSTVRYWARHGSTRYLWTQREMRDVITYVVDGQGEQMAWYRADDLRLNP